MVKIEIKKKDNLNTIVLVGLALMTIGFLLLINIIKSHNLASGTACLGGGSFMVGLMIVCFRSMQDENNK